MSISKSARKAGGKPDYLTVDEALAKPPAEAECGRALAARRAIMGVTALTLK